MRGATGAGVAAGVAVGVAAVLVAGGCAGRAKRFPTAEELVHITKAPLPSQILNEDHPPVESWELKGPFPSAPGVVPIDDPDLWTLAVREVAASKVGLVTTSQAMRCAARELATFALAHDGSLPGTDLARFAAGRCGSVGSAPEALSLVGEIDPAESDAAVAERWGPQLADMARRSLGKGNRDVGAAFVRNAARGVLVVAAARRDVHLEPAPLLVDGEGRVHLRGELLVPMAQLYALVNQGEFGHAECEDPPRPQGEAHRRRAGALGRPRRERRHHLHAVRGDGSRAGRAGGAPAARQPPARRTPDPPVYLAGTEALSSSVAEAVERGELDLGTALDRYMNGAVQLLHRPVQGRYFEVRSIDEVEFPHDMVHDSPLGVIIAVARYRPRGEPWKRWVVFVITAKPRTPATST